MSRLPGERAPVSAPSSASLLAPAARGCAAASARGDHRGNARCAQASRLFSTLSAWRVEHGRSLSSTSFELALL